MLHELCFMLIQIDLSTTQVLNSVYSELFFDLGRKDKGYFIDIPIGTICFYIMLTLSEIIISLHTNFKIDCIHTSR